MNTLKLFNAVIAKASDEAPYVSTLGYMIEPSAMWAKDRIEAYMSYYTVGRLRFEQDLL